MAERETSPMVQQITLTTLVVVLAIFLFRLTQGEAAFCRSVLANLAAGRQSVQHQIDWDHLQALDVNVGATYSRLPNEREKGQYRHAFVQNFATAFQRTGVTLKHFTGWRVAARSGGHIMVAVDYPAKQKTLLFSVPAGWGVKKVQAIRWQ